MKSKKSFLLLLLFLSTMSVKLITIHGTIEGSEIDRINKKLQNTAEDTILKAEINITAPVGYTLYNKTPIIIKLKDLASQMPEGIDVFGNETGDLSDDIKWNAVYVTESDRLLPSQIDDIDDQPGYSDNDEIVFQLPEDMNIVSGEQATFSLYFGTNSNDLPTPYFPEVCKIYDYPRQPEIEAIWGVDMVQESYNIENGILRATVLVEAAWSSGGIYELDLLDDLGNSRFNFIKQKFPFPWEPHWKWTRFTCIEQFVENNDDAGTNPFFLLKTITGPVRAQIVMKSIASYGKSGSAWGQVPGVYAVATYNVFANLPYFDYSLTTEGPNAAGNPELNIRLWNRDYGGGSYSPYKYIYVPGQGYLKRIPDNLGSISVIKDQFAEPWMIQKLQEGEQMRPSSIAGPYDDKLGYGMIFDDSYFVNSTWGQTEMVKFHFYQNFGDEPLTARYFPFDHLITNDGITYMENMYQEWKRPDPTINLNISLVSTSEVSFDYIFITKPFIDFDNTTNTLNITNIQAISTVLGEINDSTPGVTNTYDVLFNANKSETTVSGILNWDNDSKSWNATNVDLSSLSLTFPYTVNYVVVAFFSTENTTGISPPSIPFPELSEIPDTDPPIIKSLSQFPPSIVRSTDIVNITVLVTDEEGEVVMVILSYNNGSWHNVTMEYQTPLYFSSIPAQPEGKVVTYKIIASDDSDNWNETSEFSYTVLVEYKPGQGIIPLFGGVGLLIAVVLVALKTSGIHKQKYDQVE